MNRAPSSAARNANGLNVPAPSASDVPTSTGATAAGSVRGRAAMSQMRAVADASARADAAIAYARRGKRAKSGRRFSR